MGVWEADKEWSDLNPTHNAVTALDCCDGSDEWAGYIRCPNICDEIGKKAREEEEKRLATLKEGYQKRQELAKEGKKMKEEKLVSDLEFGYLPCPIPASVSSFRKRSKS